MFKKFFASFAAAIFFVSAVPTPGFSAEKKSPDKKVEKNAEKKVTKKSVWQPEIRIGILSGVTAVNLQLSAPGIMVDAKTQKTIKKIPAGKNFAVDFAAMKPDSVEIRGEKIPLKDLQTTINGKKYFGGVRVNKTTGTLTIINLAPVEEYLRGVVPEEMIPTFEIEALKAQAVAARTFTLKNRKRHASEGFDLCKNTHCQTYEGAVSNSTTDKAISETRGEVIFFAGKIADTNFHTDSGGMTENVVDVWGTHLPYLKAVPELKTKTNAWTKNFPATEFAKKIGVDEIKSVKLSKLEIGKSAADRTASGRVKFAQIVGKKKTVKISGIDLRSKFSLPGTLFDMKFEKGEIVFEGFGSGHGVGMSQYGANDFAKAGKTYKEILAHYYTGTELKKLY